MLQTSFQYNLKSLKDAAQFVIEHAGNSKLWCFYGLMGAGKTTLIKEVCKQLELTDEVSSPTFSLVNEYKLGSGKLIYHFDFYRVNNIEEVYDMGYEDYFYSDNLCLIEWPEKIEEILKDESYIEISISMANEGRQLKISHQKSG
ncbi:MAG: tRNA (adenosine(37)-N6)-threonylcarbamoyltransferase complex ATPase subunit type 1 TsaE [Bacteroidota bacterium]|nr:tRNA (adenosine(37)-N6)-threonylcarbamoyltransferase complex ATPase subunit type 1 TsaE [Bacteroidota bacterium]